MVQELKAKMVQELTELDSRRAHLMKMSQEKQLKKKKKMLQKSIPKKINKFKEEIGNLVKISRLSKLNTMKLRNRKR